MAQRTKPGRVLPANAKGKAGRKENTQVGNLGTRMKGAGGKSGMPPC